MGRQTRRVTRRGATSGLARGDTRWILDCGRAVTVHSGGPDVTRDILRENAATKNIPTIP